ncbi:putative high light inducible protein [Prochlorococcus marinus str. MIT 9321]|uniref:Putative high light inducible protein n=1 Tax=Prochlorococcus marinus str. MIT 9401 TaxID=167551 RepID=A0A0A2B4H8_PROMR|nr:hypothetical protein [Prochlorococcus marinus]KGG04087.1 putative high light inducible protein [Prochlorococcus marinus str. MIT 9321]KGG04823.1 putative high light inducible protein [Prochlorococcus marinus str. MIT 9322]KGG07690.1 putative high light inducible protein [Prochlorococcus marinus str. MIT 9401]
MKKQPKIEIKEKKNFVDKNELNLWKRGFTPQAEIWNGRMATIGIGIIFIIFALISQVS